ncbi:MAG: DNA repair protein RecN [Fibrobacteraceae bacterium]|nr:DNA repair protein RecN [Fibrobacteraceae bacterium]
MLKQLTIRNFALIPECSISFGPGFSVITGETGAGKSVLMDALRIVAGGKTLTTMIRHDAEKASVEAVFDISKNKEAKRILQKEEIEADDEIVVQREILIGGKSRARVNGTVINFSTLENLGETLVQMHGQSNQLLLRDLRTQLGMLDDFCGTSAELQAYSSEWNSWNKLKDELEKTETNAKSLAEQKEFLKFQKDELEKADVYKGEEEALEAKTSAVAKSEVKLRYIEEMRNLFDGESGLMAEFRSFQSKTRQLSSKLPEFDSWNKTLEEALDPLETIEKELRKADSGVDVSPAEIDKANSRLALIQRLKRKYRTDESGLLELKDRRTKELESLENLDADLAEIKKKIKISENSLFRYAAELSSKRKAGQATLDNKVEKILHSLGMPKAKFLTSITEESYSPTGKDRVEFCIAPNVGEGEKPLRLAVSGGELSRVLLAFKSVLAELDNVPLLVFDEVDSGISGEIGNNVGNALREIGRFHQVLAITHLQQVACRAKSHLAVQKHENGEGRTISTVKLLSYNERVVEIARMLGDAKSPVSLAHAKELLEETNASK